MDTYGWENTCISFPSKFVGHSIISAWVQVRCNVDCELFPNPRFDWVPVPPLQVQESSAFGFPPRAKDLLPRANNATYSLSSS